MLAHRGFQGLRRSSEDILDVRRQPVIRVGGVQMPHRQQMFEDVLRQMASAQFFGPRLDRHVDIRDLAPQCLAVLGGEGVQILRLRSGQLVNLADVRAGSSRTAAITCATSRPATGDVRPEPKGSRMVPSRRICSAAQGRKNGPS